MAATKEQERKALEEIENIVERLGEDSYLSYAFEGCFEVAKSNIEFDFAGQSEVKSEHRQLKEANNTIERLNGEIKGLEKKIKNLEEQIDELEEWETCTDVGTQMSQKDYMELAEPSCGTSFLTDEEAKRYIEDEFGFCKAYIEIKYQVETFKKSKRLCHHAKVENRFERKPLYNASDWNYIRFNCKGLQYELINGDLKQYID